ncbi:MAG: hypothetical protein ACOYL6_09365 [Bacteriovoracaceae bacterium]
MKKCRKVICLSFFLVLSSYADETVIFKMRQGDSISDILYNEFSIGTPGNPRLYGKKGMVQDILKLNKLPPKNATKMQTGFSLRLPENLNTFLEKNPEIKKNKKTNDTLFAPLNDFNPEFKEEKESRTKLSTTKANQDEDEEKIDWVWQRPHFIFLGGTYFTNQAKATSSSTNSGLSRHLQPIVGSEIDLRWGSEEYYWEATSRVLFTKNMAINPRIPLEFWAQERFSYPGLKLAKVVLPYFDVNFERFYFNQPGVGDKRLTKSEGFWGGIGLNIPINFSENRLSFFLSYLQAVSANASGNGESKDLTGYQLHSWARYGRSGPFFIELHTQKHIGHTATIDLSTFKLYSLGGIEF